MTLLEALSELDKNNYIVYKDDPDKNQYKIREATVDEFLVLIHNCEEHVNNVIYCPDQDPDDIEPYEDLRKYGYDPESDLKKYSHKFTVTGNELLAILSP